MKPARPAPAAVVPPLPRLEDDWRRWIAENLLLGASRQQLAERLCQKGCPPAVALAEIEMAASSPYLAAAEILQRRIDKRDWLLRSSGQLATLDPQYGEVPRKAHLPAADFYRDHYAAQRPVLLTGLIDHWPAMRLWSLDHLAATVGDAEIEVQAGREANATYELDSPRHARRESLATVLGWLREDRTTNDFYVTANNDGLNRTSLAPLWREVGDLPGYLDAGEGGGRFFWMGPRGTVTPFHHDLTNNLLVQVRGRKRVTLVPAWETPRMRNFRHCFSGHDGPQALAALPPEERPVSMTCTIEPGEALFLPVGWWHHVEGLDMTIGLSFTNFLQPNDFYSDYRCHGAM